ncbi:MAG: GNAT family N-acetyltransferase [Actinobacteria bacterium]|nr:GNAT family N-acetyltransferase [Actinomycetota bacterium]
MTAVADLRVERLPVHDAAVGRAWTLVQQQGGVTSPFLSRQWYAALADVPELTAQAETLVCMQGATPVGLLPVQVVTRNGLRTLGVAGWDWFTPDHLDVVAAPQHRAAVADRIARSLATRRDWDVLDLDALAAGSPLADALRTVMRRPRFVARPDEPVSVRARHVAADDGLFVGKWARKRLRRALRLVEEQNGTLEFVTEPDRVVALLDVLMSLHQSRFGDRSTVFATPERRRFHRIAAESLCAVGSARIARLRVGDVDAALLYMLSWESTAYLYSSGLQPDVIQSGGSVLRDWVLTQAAAQGFTLVDFLRGDQDWKDQVADHTFADTRVRYVRTTPRVLAAGAGRVLGRRRPAEVT